MLFNEFGSYSLEILSKGYDVISNETIVIAKSENTEAGLYNLEVKADSIDFVEPNSVFVRETLDPPLTILWYTDTHYATKLRDSTPLGTISRKENFKRLVQLANFFKPDLVIITGDIVDSPYEKYFGDVRNILKLLRVPILLIPGNHDHVGGGRNFFLKYLAPSNVSMDYGPVHFICLDSGPGSTTTKLSGDQVRWMEEDLRNNQDKLIRVLLLHHPLRSSTYPPSAIENTTEVNLDMLLDLINRYNVNLVLCGHNHDFEIFHEPTLIIVDPNAFGIGHDPYSAFRFIKITPKGEIEYRYGESELPIPLFGVDIVQTQLNDGSKYGNSLIIEDNLVIPISGSWIFRLRKGEFLKVNGGEIVRKWDLGEYAAVEVKVHLEPGERKAVEVYTLEDEEPPSINITASVLVFKEVAMINLFVYLEDDVLGVKSVNLKYSLDGSNWMNAELERIRFNETLFTGKIQLEKAERIYVKCYAEDPAGHASSFYGVMEVKQGLVKPTKAPPPSPTPTPSPTPAPTPTPTPTPSPTPTPTPAPVEGTMLIIGAAIAIAIIVVAGLLLRRR